MIFGGLFKASRKRNAIRGYLQKLPRLLVRDYGFSSVYTPAQVKRTIERSGLNADYSCYAISMFSDQSGFDSYHHALGESCDFASMREEVAMAHFHGNTHFSMVDMPTGSYQAVDGGGADGGSFGHSGHHGHDGGGHVGF